MAKRKKMARRSLRKKLDVIRAAARHSYPVSDIGIMLAEIESGYVTASNPVPEPVRSRATKLRSTD
jgi:hypothetical protein